MLLNLEISQKGGFVVSTTEAEAQAWVSQHLAQRKYNYFTGFRTKDPALGPGLHYGVSYGWALWVGEGPPHVCDVFPHIVH